MEFDVLGAAALTGPALLGALALGYCIVMAAPALVLLGIRSIASRAIDSGLARISGWMERNAAETTAWIVGIIGFLLARAAAVDLGLFDGVLRL